MNKICTICLNDYSDGVSCSQCHQNICLDCFSKIELCAFCRFRYDRRRKQQSNFDYRIQRIELLLNNMRASMERLYELGLLK